MNTCAVIHTWERFIAHLIGSLWLHEKIVIIQDTNNFIYKTGVVSNGKQLFLCTLSINMEWWVKKKNKYLYLCEKRTDHKSCIKEVHRIRKKGEIKIEDEESFYSVIFQNKIFCISHTIFLHVLWSVYKTCNKQFCKEDTMLLYFYIEKVWHN